MRRILLLALLQLLLTEVSAQTQRPRIVFFDETVMSETRATEIAELTRQKFWGRVPGFGRKTPLQPRSEEERQSIPLPQWDLLFIALSASYAADAKRCGIAAGDEQLFRLQNMFLPKYKDEIQVQFAFAFSIMIFSDVIARLKDQKCSLERVDALQKGIDFVAK